MANNVRGSHGMKGAPMAGQKVNGKALKRLAKQLFRDYPVQLTVVLICIALSALIGIAPAVYIETITGYIEEGLTSSWDGVSGKIFSAITTMVILYVCGLACSTLYTQLMARVTQGFLHKTRTRMFAGMQKLPIINESGLYSLVLSSKLPGAKEFKRWVTSEILPSIRKHGAYMTPETLQAAILNPDTMIQLCQQLKNAQEKNRELSVTNSRLTVENQIMQPKAEYFDELVDRNLLTNFRETAKELECKPRKFVEFLIERKYIYRDKRGKLLPYENKNDGLFVVRECFNEKTQWSGTQTMVTPKGRETFRLLLV